MLAVALSAYALYFMVQRFADFSIEHDARMEGSRRVLPMCFAPTSPIAKTCFAVVPHEIAARRAVAHG